MSELVKLALRALVAAVREANPEDDPDFRAAMQMSPGERLALGVRLSEETLRLAQYDLREIPHRGDDFRL